LGKKAIKKKQNLNVPNKQKEKKRKQIQQLRCRTIVNVLDPSVLHPASKDVAF